MHYFRECWRLAGPLIVSNLSVPLLGMVDTAVVGHLDEPYHLAAVALGATTVSVLYFLFGFLRMGTTALAAQALGASDPTEMRASLVRGLLVAVVIGFALVAAAPLIIAAARLLYAPGSEAADGMSRYLAIRLLGAPAALSTLVLLGWFLGLQDSMRPLLLMLVTNGLNAALAVLLVYGAGMEAGGVALATVLAEHAGLLLAFFLARRRWRAGAAPGRAAIFIAARFRQLLGMNRDLSLRSLLLEAVFVALPAIGGRLGEVTLAANAVLMTLFTAAAYGLDGFAHATEAQVGRAVGARSGTDFRGAVRAGFISAGVLALLMSLAFAMLGLPLIRILTGLQEVRTEAATFLPYAAMVPVVAVWAFLYDGVFFGAARAAALRDGMLIAGLGFAAAAAALVPAFGNHGLWLAFLAFLGARGLILAVFYRQAQARAPFVGEVAPVTA